MAEKSPAPPPAWAMSSPPSRNFGQGHRRRTARACPRRCRRRPGRSRRPGAGAGASSSSRRRALLQPASRKTRRCSGETTSIGVEADHELRVRDRAQAHRANDAASDSGVRDSWSTMPRTPSPAKSVTADCSGSRPRSTCERLPRRSGSCSAKQNVYLPGWPSVARSISPGARRPRCGSRAAARGRSSRWRGCPGPSALMPEFMPIARVIGPFDDDDGPGEPRRGEQPVHVELVGARGLDRGEHDRAGTRAGSRPSPR